MEAVVWFFLIAQFTAPVAFAALGETVGQKAGVLNIGLEGTILVACYAAVVASAASGSWIVGLLAAVAIGAILNLIQGFFTVVLASDQVVAGTAVNLIGLGLTSTLFDAGIARGQKFSGVAGIPKLPFGVDILLLSLPLLAWGVHWLLFRTQFGLALRGAGEYPPAVESDGFSVIRLRLIALLIGGVFAGLAGAYLTLGTAGSFAPNMTAGRGFIAIALVTFGRWKPLWVLAASFLIGILDWLQVALQGRSAIPIQFFMALPYVVALIVLVVVGKGTQTPQSLGLAYRREK